MTFDELRDYIRGKMRRGMQHVYQPVMLQTLLRNDGAASSTQIAKAILPHDHSQVEYYEEITKRMVGRVLVKNAVVERHGNMFSLPDVEGISGEERDELIALCGGELTSFLARRGEKLFDHRRLCNSNIPGTIRYEVLKAAGFRCMLCGISADDCFLDVDHIEPRSKHGRDDISNYQALCYRCNQSKGNRDSTDLRPIPELYGARVQNCVFCTPTDARKITENRLAYALWDNFAVTPFHALIIPKRHQSEYFDLSQSELNACDQLLRQTRAAIIQRDSKVKAFNIGVNDGEPAGQTILHCHIHLIPRRVGDVEQPRGGIRHVIPGKGNY